MTSQTPALFQAAPQISHEPPENFTSADVSLKDLEDVEASLVAAPGARFSTTQRFFFQALLSHPTLDPHWAAKQVGIKPAKAKRWLANPAVQTTLNHLATKRAQKIGLSPENLLRKMVKLLDMATGDLPVHKTFMDKGSVWTEQVLQTDLAAAARFTDQLGKHLKIFTPEGEQAQGVTLNLNMGGETMQSVDMTPSNPSDPIAAPAASFSLNMTGAEDAEFEETPAGEGDGPDEDDDAHLYMSADDL